MWKDKEAKDIVFYSSNIKIYQTNEVILYKNLKKFCDLKPKCTTVWEKNMYNRLNTKKLKKKSVPSSNNGRYQFSMNR